MPDFFRPSKHSSAQQVEGGGEKKGGNGGDRGGNTAVVMGGGALDTCMCGDWMTHSVTKSFWCVEKQLISSCDWVLFFGL